MNTKTIDSDLISPVILSQTGDKTARIATPQDLQNKEYLMDQFGLTKREYFAAKAMQGILSDPQSNERKMEDIARYSVKCADLLIIELNK